MAADVSCLVSVMNGSDRNESGTAGKSSAPITRDFLGGCLTIDSKELDLDLQVPCGWEKRLDLKSGKVFLHRSSSSNPPSCSTFQNQIHQTTEDLNSPPQSKPTLNLFDDSILDLKLPSQSPNYHSVCTLDKVKSALERAEQDSRKRSFSTSKSPSPLSNSSSLIRELDSDRSEKPCGSFAAGCPNCLLYVLISSVNPRCPRCNSYVPLPLAPKKPRIDLNISI